MPSHISLFSPAELRALKAAANEKAEKKATASVSTASAKQSLHKQLYFRADQQEHKTKQTVTLKLLHDGTVLLFGADGAHTNCRSADELWRRLHSPSFVSAGNKKQTVEEYLASGGTITQCPAAKAENAHAGFTVPEGRRPVLAAKGPWSKARMPI